MWTHSSLLCHKKKTCSAGSVLTPRKLQSHPVTAIRPTPAGRPLMGRDSRGTRAESRLAKPDPASHSTHTHTQSAGLIKSISRLPLWPTAAKLASCSFPASESYGDNFRPGPLISHDNVSAATS